MPGAGWIGLGAGLSAGSEMYTRLRQQAIENAIRERQMKLEEEDRKRQREDLLRRTRQEDLQRAYQFAVAMQSGKEIPSEMAGAFTPEQQAIMFTPPITPEEARLPSAGFKPGMALPPMPGQPPSTVPQLPMQRGPMVPGLEAGKRYTRDIFQAPSVQAQERRSETSEMLQPFLAEMRANTARLNELGRGERFGQGMDARWAGIEMNRSRLQLDREVAEDRQRIADAADRRAEARHAREMATLPSLAAQWVMWKVKDLADQDPTLNSRDPQFNPDIRYQEQRRDEYWTRAIQLAKIEAAGIGGPQPAHGGAGGSTPLDILRSRRQPR